MCRYLPQIEVLMLIGVLGFDRPEKVLLHTVILSKKSAYFRNCDVIRYIESHMYNVHVYLVYPVSSLALCHLYYTCTCR